MFLKQKVSRYQEGLKKKKTRKAMASKIAPGHHGHACAGTHTHPGAKLSIQTNILVHTK